MGLEEHGAGEAGKGGSDGGVEALEVAGSENTAAGCGKGDELVGFGEGGGEGFFDQNVEICFEELRSDWRMGRGRNGDRGGLQVEVGGEEIVDGGEAGDVVAEGGVRPGLRVRVDDGG